MPCSSSTVASAKMLRMSSSTISTFLPAARGRRRAAPRARCALAPRTGRGRLRCSKNAAWSSSRSSECDLAHARTRCAGASSRAVGVARPSRRRRRSAAGDDAGAPLDASRSRPRGRSRRTRPSTTTQSTARPAPAQLAAPPRRATGSTSPSIDSARSWSRAASRGIGSTTAARAHGALAVARRAARAASSTRPCDCSGLATKPSAPDSQRALARRRRWR